MRELALLSCQQPKHRYKRAKQESSVSPNLLARQFNVGSPNKVWCGEHPFRIIKCQCGFRKAIYRGLAKNDSKLVMLFTLANVF